MEDFRVVLTGGGTSGHVIPLLAVAERLQELVGSGGVSLSPRVGRGLHIEYMGFVNRLNRGLLEKSGFPFSHVPSGKIRRYLEGVPLTFYDLVVLLPLGILVAAWKLWRAMPDVVFSKGGFGSVPVVLMAWVYRIPILMHETDSVPGIATKRLARFATSIAVSFTKAEKEFPRDKVFVSGTPVRSDITSLTVEEGRDRVGVQAGKPVLVIVGGSQGSRKINRVVLEILPELLFTFQVVHLTGSVHESLIKNFAKELLNTHPYQQDYHPFGFMDDMSAVYAAADLIVSRAGGTTLAEIAATGKASILIPLPTAANDHQRANAYVFREAGATRVIEEPNLSSSLLLATIKELIRDPSVLGTMGERARALSKRNATDSLARMLVLMAEGKALRLVEEKV